GAPNSACMGRHRSLQLLDADVLELDPAALGGEADVALLALQAGLAVLHLVQIDVEDLGAVEDDLEAAALDDDLLRIPFFGGLEHTVVLLDRADAAQRAVQVQLRLTGREIAGAGLEVGHQGFGVVQDLDFQALRVDMSGVRHAEAEAVVAAL